MILRDVAAGTKVDKDRWVLPLAGVAGMLLLIAFLFVETRSAAPPLALFRSCSFSGANLLTFLLYAALSGVLFFFPLNLIPGYRSVMWLSAALAAVSVARAVISVGDERHASA